MTVQVVDCPLAKWAGNWVEGADVPPEAVFVRGGGPHSAEIASRLPEALVVSWIAEGGTQELMGRVIRSPASGFIETVARRSMTLALEAYRASPPMEGIEPSAALFNGMLAAARRRALVEQGTLSGLASLWHQNLASNAERIARGASVTALGGRMRGRPVFVVGAGPSLDRSLPLLRQAAGRAGIIAATSAARPLSRAGIVPDALVVIEGRDCMHHFEGVERGFIERTVLIADSTTAPAHLDLPFAATFLFHGGLAAWLEPWSGRGSVIPTGGNVGTAATVVAWITGGSPVVLAGLDFALDGDRYYAAEVGSIRRDGSDEAASEVAGWGSEAVFSTPELICYREQTEEVIAAIGRRDPHTRFQSLAAAGARVRGAGLVTHERMSRIVGRSTPGRVALARAWKPAGGCRQAVAGSAERKAAIDARLASLVTDGRGPAHALVTLRPADSLPMIVAGPPIISAHRDGERSVEAVRQRLRVELDRYAESGNALVEALARSAAR